MIGNTPINETSFARDPSYPITEAYIPTLLHKQTGLPVGTISLEDVSKGSNNVSQKIKNSEQKVIVVDATEENHLQCIAQALSMSIGSWLPCGSAGLAKEFPLALGYKPIEEKPFEPTVSTKPVLAVVGSRNYTSLKQMKTAETFLSLPVISIEPDKFVDRQGKLTGLRMLIQEVANFINCGKSVLITTALSRYVPDLKEFSAKLLARIVARTVHSCELAGLFLTGGDIARETCSTLGVAGIRILKELEPGVVFGEAIETVKGDIKVVTKAGGFGRDKTIVDAIYYLRGDERWKRK